MSYGHGAEIAATLTAWLPEAWAEIHHDITEEYAA